MTHPVHLVVADDLRRRRLTVLFRLPLVLPHYVWLMLWSWAIVLVVPFQWLSALFAGRIEEDVHRFLARYVRYQVHVTAYTFLLVSPWPGFQGRAGYPVDVEIDPAEAQSRASVLFRAVLAVPALVLGSVFGTVLSAVGFAGWFVALALGRLPAGMVELGAYCLRYQTQVYAYVLLLTGRYPTLSAPALTVG